MSKNQTAEYRREYYLNNREKKLQQSRDRYATKRDEILAAQKEHMKDPAVRAAKTAQAKKRYHSDPEARRAVLENKKKAYVSTPDGWRSRRLMTRYGITVGEYDALLENQGGKCALCERDTHDVLGRRLAVDHNHKTGVVRGLLCMNCNTKVAGLEDADQLARTFTYMLR